MSRQWRRRLDASLREDEDRQRIEEKIAAALREDKLKARSREVAELLVEGRVVVTGKEVRRG
jgi:hypothetical protein